MTYADKTTVPVERSRAVAYLAAKQQFHPGWDHSVTTQGV